MPGKCFAVVLASGPEALLSHYSAAWLWGLATHSPVLAAGLPRPAINCNIAGLEVDLYWPEQRFVVELDLYETHGTREAFEEDRLRQEDLLLEGVGVTRVTGPRFEREPDSVLARIARLLAERVPSG